MFFSNQLAWTVNSKGNKQADETSRDATLSNMSAHHTLQDTLILQSMDL